MHRCEDLFHIIVELILTLCLIIKDKKEKLVKCCFMIKKWYWLRLIWIKNAEGKDSLDIPDYQHFYMNRLYWIYSPFFFGSFFYAQNEFHQHIPHLQPCGYQTRREGGRGERKKAACMVRRCIQAYMCIICSFKFRLLTFYFAEEPTFKIPCCCLLFALCSFKKK